MSARPPLLSHADERILELRVLNGLHRGATLPLDGDAASLGSDEHNDVVLLDPGIAAQHARLQRNPQAGTHDDAAGTPSAPWQLHHHDGSIVPLWPEQAVPLGPLRIVLADEGSPWEPWLNELNEPAKLPLAETAAPPAQRRPAISLIAVWAGAGLIGIVAGLLTLSGLHDASASTGKLPQQPIAAVPASAPAPVLVYPAPPTPPPQFAAPPFTLQRVTAAFVVTIEGERLLPGDSYQGYKLIAIEPHSVLFNDGSGNVAALAW